MKIVMLANNPCVFDARIRREAEALVEAGCRVTVLATAADHVTPRETVAGVDYHRLLKVREIGKSLAAEAGGSSGHQRLSVLVKALAFRIGRQVITPSIRHLIGYARAYRQAIIDLEPDVVHAHDLDTLFAGWLGTRKSGAKLIYDAHELETDRNLPLVRFEKTYRALIERWLIRHCAAVITVSDSIADHLAKRYRLPRPAVVLNAPVTTEAIRPDRRLDLRADLDLPEDVPLALYVGGLMPGRGIDQAVRALPHAPHLQLAALGPRQEVATNDILELAENLGVRDRLRLVDPVPPEQLKRYIARADLSLILLQNTCLNHYYCFPNKLLQSLLAGVPVLVSRLIELERMVAMTGAGKVVDETDPQAIAQAMDDVIAAPELYRPTPLLIRSLEMSHGWPAQRRRLLTCYGELDPAFGGSVSSVAA